MKITGITEVIEADELMVFYNLFKNNQDLSDVTKEIYNAIKLVIIESHWLSENASKIYMDNCKIKKNVRIIDVVTFINHIDDYIDALEVLSVYSYKKNELMFVAPEENEKLKKLTDKMVNLYEHEHDRLMESLL